MRFWPRSTRTRFSVVVFIVTLNILLAWHEFSKPALKTLDAQVRQHEFTLQKSTYEFLLPEQFILTVRESTTVVFSVPDTRSEPRITFFSAMTPEIGPLTKCIAAKAGHSICYRTDSIPNGNGPKHERVSGNVSWGAGKNDLYFTIDGFAENYEPDPGLLLHYLRFLKRSSAGG